MKPAAGNMVDLREAIAASELSRYEIAKRAEISASLLSLFVNGQRSLTLDTAAKVATVLGLVLKPKYFPWKRSSKVSMCASLCSLFDPHTLRKQAS